MPYTKLLNNIIADSNLSYKFIAEKCTEMGTTIDPSYISKLLSGKCNVPSEKISRALANVCGYDERLLVLEGYLDIAPKEIKDILYNLQKLTVLSTINFMTTISDTEITQAITDTLATEPLNTFLVGLLEQQENTLLKFENKDVKISSLIENINVTMKEPISFSIETNDMTPIIPKNSKVMIEMQKHYTNGDIIAFKDENNLISARYYLSTNDTVVLTAIDKKAKPIILDKENITIMGKVKKVITEIQ
jgi:transcriptional regulator with XRE-family HTH domain